MQQFYNAHFLPASDAGLVWNYRCYMLATQVCGVWNLKITCLCAVAE
jgi:hypothetical protein